MTSQWRHRNKTHSCYSELNYVRNLYFVFFIFWKLTELCRFVTYLWDDPCIIEWNKKLRIRDFQQCQPITNESDAIVKMLQGTYVVVMMNASRTLCNDVVTKSRVDFLIVKARSVVSLASLCSVEWLLSSVCHVMELLSVYVVTWLMNYVIVELKCATNTYVEARGAVYDRCCDLMLYACLLQQHCGINSIAVLSAGDWFV